MIPQDSFTIVARIQTGSIDALRSLLTTMNYANCAGFADPDNPLVPFGDFKTIHFARFVVLADNTLEDSETSSDMARTMKKVPTCSAGCARTASSQRPPMSIGSGVASGKYEKRHGCTAYCVKPSRESRRANRDGSSLGCAS